MRKASLSSRLQQFFKANPGEELTTTDICEKFGVKNPKNVWSSLAYGRRKGLFKTAVTEEVRTYTKTYQRRDRVALWSKS